MYYALAENEDFFADKVSVFIALGPVMRLSHAKSTLIDVIAYNRGLIIGTC